MLEFSDAMIAGRYRLMKRLRRGGMSEIFQAFDEQTRQDVAIKLVMSDNADDIKRLQREIRILRKLSHEHILPLLDGGLEDSYCYLVMPYMRRGNLRERLVQGKMTQEEAGSILNQLAGALAYAHERGIIHRDIKPSNVLLDNTNPHHVYLADFGLATILREGSDITQTGCLIGTPEYMAPELAYMPESISSDIYALGVLLYQMLTGQLPFTGNAPFVVFWKHIKEQPELPSVLYPQISPAIEQVIMRALDKDPAYRFPDAPAMALAYADALRAGDQHSKSLAAGMLTLPPSQVKVYKVSPGLKVVFPSGIWSGRVGHTALNRVASLSALGLLILVLSLGVVVGSHIHPSLGSTVLLGNNLIPPAQSTPIVSVASPGGATGSPATPHHTASHHPASHPLYLPTQKDEPSHSHGHGHGHGHKHGPGWPTKHHF